MSDADDSSESHRTDRDLVRHRLYELMENSGLSLQEKQQQALSISREHLGVANGHIQRQTEDGETDEIIASTGENPDMLPTGTVVDRAKTYCRRTVDASSPVALSNVPEQGLGDDPAYIETGFECYLGTTIFVRGEVYGTVCFISQTARETDFTTDEKAFVELVARLLGRQIEAEEYEARIERERDHRKQTETKHEALVQLAPNAIFLAEPESGQIIEVNKKAAKLTGYSEDELVTKTVFDMIPDDPAGKYSDLFSPEYDTLTRDRLDDGSPLLLRRSDGTEIPVEISLTLVELPSGDVVQGIVRDISARRDRERDLRLRSQAMEETPIGITIGDAQQDDIPIVYANDGFKQLTGYSHDRVIGSNCRFLQGEGTDPDTVADIRAAIDAEEPIQTEILNYRANGTPFWNKVTIAPVMAKQNGTVSHYVGIQEDVTAQNRRERLVEVLNRVLRHNIRNTVGAINGFAGIIADESDGDIESHARRIERLSQDIIGLGEKAQAFQTGLGSTDTLVTRDIVTDIEAVVSSLETTYPGSEFGISGVESASVLASEQIRLVLEELGDNAAKHGEGSPVEYTVEETAEYVAVHVSDGGPGLPDIEQRVFETGQETPLEHGSGIGLWLVNWVVTGLGGTVTATTDGGTTITVRLPVVSDAVEPGEHQTSLNSVLGNRQL